MTDETKDILNIEEAAKLLGVSVKTFNKVLHHECLPARKIGREWKFSRAALIDWVASGRSVDFYREAGERNGTQAEGGDGAITPARRPADKATARRTSGWRIELD